MYGFIHVPNKVGVQICVKKCCKLCQKMLQIVSKNATICVKKCCKLRQKMLLFVSKVTICIKRCYNLYQGFFNVTTCFARGLLQKWIWSANLIRQGYKFWLTLNCYLGNMNIGPNLIEISNANYGGRLATMPTVAHFLCCWSCVLRLRWNTHR